VALLAINAPDAEVAACYEAALALAREVNAATSELCAATHLVGLRRQQGQATAAMALLQQIYRVFSEGFATPDLRAAKALLDEPWQGA